jgi:hypothetical protein
MTEIIKHHHKRRRYSTPLANLPPLIELTVPPAIAVMASLKFGLFMPFVNPPNTLPANPLQKPPLSLLLAIGSVYFNGLFLT